MSDMGYTSHFEERKVKKLALAMILGGLPKSARVLFENVEDINCVFDHPAQVLGRLPHFPQEMLDKRKWQETLVHASEQYERLQDEGITPLLWGEDDYPYRLRECADAPLVLYVKGIPEVLSKAKIVSVVGTRKASAYGRAMTEKIVCGLQERLGDELLILSGLAYGIDIVSHTTSLTHGITTAAVLAHGLDTVYPAAHAHSAKRIITEGGALISEFPCGVKPERYHFVARNRIVAGLADVTLVIESADKGGSLITASLANSYHREVMAVPGRALDALSQGCNRLIKQDVARMVEDADDVCRLMNWECRSEQPQAQSLFVELTKEEEQIVAILEKEEEVSLDEIVRSLNIPVHKLSAILFNMELSGIVSVSPGNRYRIK